MHKNIHIHLPALLKKSVKVKDAQLKIGQLVRSNAGVTGKIVNIETILGQQSHVVIETANGKRYGSLANQLKVLDSLVKDAKPPTTAELRAYIAIRNEVDKAYAEIEKIEKRGARAPWDLLHKAEQLRQKENSISNEVKQVAGNLGMYK